MIRRLPLLLPFLPLLHAAEPKDESLVASQALPGAATPPGTRLRIEADGARLGVRSPTALALDAKGRILVTETHRFGTGILDDRDHPESYLDDLAARSTADRLALHEKWKHKVPISRLTAESEIVRLLSCADNDGSLDTTSVFADGFNGVLDGTMAGVFEYEGAVYLACIPKLLLLRDADHDGKADTRETIAEGFGARISLSGHDLNGFALGPDGRIYGTIGDRGFNVTTREGVKLEHPNEGAVFRFEPDGSGFELMHTGLRNPKEIAFNALGDAFTVDNNSDQGDKARIVYLIEGGNSGWEMEHQTMHSFHRQIGLAKRPPNRWMDERIWETANPEQPAHIVPPCVHLTSGPSGLTYHPGTGFLEGEDGRFLICDYRGSPAVSGIWSFAMKPEGAGMALADARRIVRGVAATDAEYSWDGRLWITDFGGGWKSHEGGRLLSLDTSEKPWRADQAAGVARILSEGFEQRSASELGMLLAHPDTRVRLRAQLALTRKPEALDTFRKALASTQSHERVHGIWGLGILARRGAALLPAGNKDIADVSARRSEALKSLVALLQEPDAEIRAQALRSISWAPSIDDASPLIRLISDPSPRVRAFAAIAVGKLKATQATQAVIAMIAENDNRDPYLRHAGSFALQGTTPDPAALGKLSSHPSAAVRLAAVVALRRSKHPELATFLHDADPRVAGEAIRAICDLDLKDLRPAVTAVLDTSHRAWTPFMLRRLIHNAWRVGGAENARRLLDFATSPNQALDTRQEAFRLLEEWAKPFPADQFTGHWNPLPERDPAPLVALLHERLPSLLKSTDFQLTAALDLVRHYGIQPDGLDEETLRVFVSNASLPEESRNAALRMLIDRKPADIAPFLTRIAAEAPPQVAITALRRLAQEPPATSLPALRAAIESSRTLLMREAWKLLSPVPGDEADGLFVAGLQRLLGTQAVAADAIELIEAARLRDSTPVRNALAALDQSLAKAGSPLALWNPSLEGGDPEIGKELFVSHPAGECMRCHQVGYDHDNGGSTAPNLAGVAKRSKDRRQLLESVVSPGSVVAPGFGTVALTFHNGASISGVLSSSDADHIDLDYEGRAVRVKRSDVASSTDPVSAMPPMADLLKPAEVRDLVAWLATLDQETTLVSTKAAPQVLDPESLPKPSTPASANVDPAMMKTGRAQFIVCGACHGQSGEGTAAGPPLAGSEWVTGPVENLIRIQLRGLEGPITVKGREYNFPAGMAPLAYQTDEQIAAVLTYIRNDFGNSASAVTPEQVAALRSEVGKPRLKAADLAPPVATTESTTATAGSTNTAASPAASKYANLRTSSGAPKGWIAAGILAAAVVAFLVIKKRGGR